MAQFHFAMGLCGILLLNTVNILLFLWVRSTCSMPSYPPPPPPIRITEVVSQPPLFRIPVANSPPPALTAHCASVISTHLKPRTGSQLEDKATDYFRSAAVEFNVLKYGAVGDSSTNDTQAFQNAWTAACAVDAGYVHAPAGYIFKVYPVIFKGPCETNMTFKVDGTLLAPKDPSIWADYGQYWLQFEKVSMTLQGRGTIDGQGQTWWADSCKTVKTNPCVDGPTAIVFNTCTNITVKNVVIRNSQQMHLAFEKSSEILVKNVTISAPGTSPNTDGIHLQNSSHVTIKNTVIGTGDDCISIQTGSFDVTIKNVQCGPGHGISVGGLGKSNSTAELSGLVVDSVVFNNATNGLRIKTWQGSSGYANKFSFTNIKMVNTKNPILIDQYYCDTGSSGSCTNYTSNVVVSSIKYKNVTGTSGTTAAVTFHCSETVACTGISLYDINLLQTTGDAATASCVDAFGTASGTVIPASCLATGKAPKDTFFS